MHVDEWGEIHPSSAERPAEKKKPLTPDCLAAEGVGVPELADLGQKLSRYGTAKARNRAMAGYLVHRAGPYATDPLRKLSAALYDCASWLEFHHYLQSKRTVLANAVTCKKHLLCPFCAIRRGAKLLRNYHERALHLVDQFDFHSVVLTVKNGPDLVERHTHLKHAFKRLRTQGRDGYGVWANVKGAIWSTEFTKSDEGWHPHLHIIVAVPKGSPPIRYGQDSPLGKQWFELTGDSFIVHAQPIRPEGDDLAAGLCEVLKYAVKFSDLDLTDNLDAYLALKGKRLVQSSGCFYGLELPENDDLLDEPLSGPYLRWFFRYGSAGYQAAEA